MDKFLTATEARQQFLRLLDEVQEGDRVIITQIRADIVIVGRRDEIRPGRAAERVDGDGAVMARQTGLGRSAGLFRRRVHRPTAVQREGRRRGFMVPQRRAVRLGTVGRVTHDADLTA